MKKIEMKWGDIHLGFIVGIIAGGFIMLCVYSRIIWIENKAQRQLDFGRGEQHIINILLNERAKKGGEKE